MTESTDVINEIAGDFGKWQLRTLLIIFLCKIPTSWFMAIIVFTAPAPKVGDFWCKPPDSVKLNHTEWIRTTHPMVQSKTDKEFKIDFCNVYRDVIDDKETLFEYSRNRNFTETTIHNASIIPCKEFHFKSDYHSLIAEFNLVCSKRLLTSLSQCFHITGLLTGGIVAYFLLKKLSPKRVMLIGMLFQILFGNLCGLTKIYELHVLFRLCVAACCALMYTSGQMILVDITGGRAKTISLILFELFWSAGIILLPALSMFVKSWSQLYTVISMPTLFLVFLHRLIPDSPRWMLQKGRLNKVKEILLKSAAANKRPIPLDIDQLVEIEAIKCLNTPNQVSWCKLWDGRPKKKVILAAYFAWAMYIILFNSMILNISSYGQEHIRFNAVALGCSEVCGAMFGLYLVLFTRRKWLWTGLFSIASGLFGYSTWLIPQNLLHAHIIALTMIPSMVIKMAASTAIAILTSSTADLVKPEKKKIFMFSCGIWARIWFLWVPFINAASIYGMVIPLTVFSCIALIGGLCCIICEFGQRSANQPNGRRINIKKNNFEVVLEKEKFLLKEKS